ncbi:hypothetical protein GCM10010269_81830 [Streptomyces humidus]|uniref:AB hydrolase-1 domain-containing protein n=1 Tax=Streptomyces humidus TaxID=52259 RepID=A0A918GE94_9ACTN|nr:hypothetical protein GCM10010269_81830 [Streptomyces humidus]
MGGSGSPVVLLHGFPQTQPMWRHEAADHTVICPDLRGYGASAKPADSDPETYSKRTTAGDVVRLAQMIQASTEPSSYTSSTPGPRRRTRSPPTSAATTSPRPRRPCQNAWAGDLRHRTAPCGHSMAEEDPELIADEIRSLADR